MNIRPQFYSDWAIDQRYDPATGFTNKIVIMKQFSYSGLKPKEYYFAEFHHTYSNLVSKWIEYLDCKSQIDDVVASVASSKTVTDIEDQYAGTWVLLGTASGIDYFRRTA